MSSKQKKSKTKSSNGKNSSNESSQQTDNSVTKPVEQVSSLGSSGNSIERFISLQTGLSRSDFSSFQSFVQLCHKPVDSSCLAVFRIVFGMLMIFDCMHERGLHTVIAKWSGNFELCQFPLFNFLKPLPVEWMVVLYILMAAGAFGIALGLFYRVACVLFVLPYWYMFLLNKRAWNNHSYLFGLISTLLLFCDANRTWSLDAKRNKVKHKDIPAWQYGLFRFQLVAVYFIAGLKKLDRDWVEGYSMQSLSHQWVFDPFRYFLTNEEIDQYIVHWGGLTVDLASGFLLFFDGTRHLGSTFVISFNVMNSRMFRIGQFPYVMLASVILFYPYDWPKKVFSSKWFNKGSFEKNSHCLYSGSKPTKAGFYHKFFSIFTICVMVWQAFMPYSHFITKGYNNWTGGLYGYSWDMMIHNWNTQHVKIKYVNKDTGEEGYLDPQAFVNLNRWPSHPDMIKQHAMCIADQLAIDYEMPNTEIYMDIWHSMNHRFQQRMVDPAVDLVAVDWSPFRPASFMLPLLNDLEGWRTQLNEIAMQAKHGSTDWFIHHADATFIADFPGMFLENFLNEDLSKTNITLLAGSAILYDPQAKKNITLEVNKPTRVGIGTHIVYVTSDAPACYMYLYSNTTETMLNSQLSQLEFQIEDQQLDESVLEKEAENNETLKTLLELKREKELQKKIKKEKSDVETSFWKSSHQKALETYTLLHKCFKMGYFAAVSLVTGESMEYLLDQQK